MIEVDSITAPPLANLMRVFFNVNNCGICGLVAESQFEISESNIKTDLLLARLLQLNIVSAPEELTLHQLFFEPGVVTLQSFVSQMKSVTATGDNLDEGIFMATKNVRLGVITGTHTSMTPVTTERLYSFLRVKKIPIETLIPAALPFLSKTPVSFTLKDIGEGRTQIEFQNVSEKQIAEFKKFMSTVLGL